MPSNLSVQCTSTLPFSLTSQIRTRQQGKEEKGASEKGSSTQKNRCRPNTHPFHANRTKRHTEADMQPTPTNLLPPLLSSLSLYQPLASTREPTQKNRRPLLFPSSPSSLLPTPPPTPTPPPPALPPNRCKSSILASTNSSSSLRCTKSKCRLTLGSSRAKRSSPPPAMWSRSLVSTSRGKRL